MDIPQGPQLKDADLTKLSDQELYRLATGVAVELATVETMYSDGEVSSDELLWVREDAETVQAEFERRGDTVHIEGFQRVIARLVEKHEALFDEETVQQARKRLDR